jgi:hypothetical protein
VDFADDGVAGDADLGGDLTAGQAGNDEASELFDALRSPGGSGHGTASRLRRPVLGRRQGESRAQQAPRDGKVPQMRKFGARRQPCEPKAQPMAPRSPSRIRP